MKKKSFDSKKYLSELKKYGNLIVELRSSLNSYRNTKSLWENNDLFNQTKRCQREIESLLGMITSIERKESVKARREKNADL